MMRHFSRFVDLFSALKPLAVLCALLYVAACGPTRTESWNSYYYGTERASSIGWKGYPQDNDDTYVVPSGSWQDNQTPQGQKW